MPDNETPILIAHWQVILGGSPVETKYIEALAHAVIDLATNMPAMAELEFYDPDLEILDSNKFAIGTALQIKVEERTPNAPYTLMFDGEIVAVQPEFDNQDNRLHIIAYDKMHRLAKGRKTATYLQQTDKEVITKILQPHGMTVEGEATSPQYDYICQDNVSDLEFIQYLANRNGRMIWVEGTKLVMKAPAPTNAPIKLKYGQEVFYFRPRLTAAHQVDKVKASWWDIKKKEAVTNQVTSSQVSAPPTSTKLKTATAAAVLFGSTEEVVLAPEIATTGAAAKYAQARMDEYSSSYLPVEGLAFGDAALKPNVKVEITQVGSLFSGVYVITEAKHIYGQESGYEVEFKGEGLASSTVASLIAPAPEARNVWHGVYPAIVTNNNDPENFGRVKLKFPWLSNTLESNWARVASIDAGNARGLMSLPEVNDEVVVAFENGSINYPYVLGGVWNGKDAIPVQTAEVVKENKVVQRVWKTRSGHTLTFMEDGETASHIEIKEKSGILIKLDGKNKIVEIVNAGNKITLDDQGKKIEVTDGANSITIDGNAKKISVKATEIDITATGNVTIKGAMVKIN